MHFAEAGEENGNPTFFVAILRDWSPFGIALRRVLRHCDGKVLTGPFCGMRYGAKAGGSAMFPKLLGCYEKEVHEWVEQLCGRRHELLINLGAGEGYYAVGMTCRSPKLKCIAFESDARSRSLLAENAELNAVRPRIEQRETCDCKSLEFLLAHREETPKALICDIEGAEETILCGVNPNLLAKVDLLVETHDFASPGVSKRMTEWFAGSHRVEVVAAKRREYPDIPAGLRSGIWDRWTIKLLEEFRPAGMKWILCLSKAIRPGHED